MSEPENPPAFPRTGEGFGNPHYDEAGMSLRDWFAGQVLPFAASRDYRTDWGPAGTGHATQAARFAYQIADAMLTERSKL